MRWVPGSVLGLVAAVLMTLALIPFASAQPCDWKICMVESGWEGELSAPGGTLPLKLLLSPAGEGGFDVVVISVAQGNARIPGTASWRGAHVHVQLPSIRAEYQGAIDDEERRIVGTWSQLNQRLPLTFERIAVEEVVAEAGASPEGLTESEEGDVTSESMSFQSFDGTVLRGTMSRPRDQSVCPCDAIVIASGSGPQPRDGGQGARNIYRDLALRFARAGVATFRFDDRGVGESGGEYQQASPEIAARDLAAAVATLSKQSGIVRVGIVGHSAGATIAALAAANAQLAFVAMLAPPGLAGAALLTWQFERGMSSSGLPEDLRSATIGLYKTIMAAVTEAPEDARPDELREAIRAKIAEFQSDYAQHEAAEAIALSIGQALEQLFNPATRAFLRLDPLNAHRRIPASLPVLVVYGDRDVQVALEVNRPLIERAFGGRANVDYLVLENHNHLFQYTTGHGGVSEYQTLPEGISERALDAIWGWATRALGHQVVTEAG